MKLNYFILISKDGQVSHEITKSFLESRELPDIMERFAEARTFDLQIDDYDVSVEIFEVESSFIRAMQSLGGVPGLVWLENAEIDVTLWEELKDIITPGEIVKGDDYNYSPKDDDIVGWIGEGPNGVIVEIQENELSADDFEDFVEDEVVC